MKFRIARKLYYLKKARHRHGHGIHSPFLFCLITNVIENYKHLLAYNILRDQHERLSNLVKNNKAQPGIQTFSDSILKCSGRKSLFKAVELPLRYGRLLFRLINEFKPNNISCYGPSFGMNFLYLALPDDRIHVSCYQSENCLHQICNETLKDAGIKNVEYPDNQDMEDESSEFVFINLPYLPDEIDKLVKAQLVSSCENNVLIIRGIHDSERMELIWNELIKNKRVRVSLDLFEIGIILCLKKLQKEHFVLRF
jgi:hypothetical protein